MRAAGQESDLGQRVAALEERSLYVVHGTADKAVHQQHAMTFARDLINKDVVFRQQVRVGVGDCGGGL